MPDADGGRWSASAADRICTAAPQDARSAAQFPATRRLSSTKPNLNTSREMTCAEGSAGTRRASRWQQTLARAVARNQTANKDGARVPHVTERPRATIISLAIAKWAFNVHLKPPAPSRASPKPRPARR